MMHIIKDVAVIMLLRSNSREIFDQSQREATTESEEEERVRKPEPNINSKKTYGRSRIDSYFRNITSDRPTTDAHAYRHCTC